MPAAKAKAKAKAKPKAVDRAAQAQLSKARHDAMQEVLDSKEVQAVFKHFSAAIKRTFDFFAQWKGASDGSMQLAGWHLLGDCFGILDKAALKIIHTHVGGKGLRAERFPEALFL